MLVVLLASACDDAVIEEHRVPQGVERMPEVPVEPPPDAGDPLDAMASRWVVPSTWTPDLEPRPMRVATYLAADESGDVEVAITRFPGRVGGELANLNRWRGQMGLPSIEEPQLEASVTRFDMAGFKGYQTRIESDAGVMLAAGVYDRAADHTWFVRATVPNVAVADRLEGDLFSFARSMAGPQGEGGR
jgi:hypothetical protein